MESNNKNQTIKNEKGNGMNINKLEKILNELFIDNTHFCNGQYINPLNYEQVSEKINKRLLNQKKAEKEIYDSLVNVAESINSNGGITEHAYEQNKYAINSVARDLTNQRWWGIASTHNCIKEDKRGEKATPELISRYKHDGQYDGGDENIFRSSREGTLFGIKYDEKGNLNHFRIYHQGHRETLIVKTCPTDDLINKINQYVSKFKEEPEKLSLDFSLSTKEYKAKIEDFNKEFGSIIQVKSTNIYDMISQINTIDINIQSNEDAKKFSENLVKAWNLSNNSKLMNGEAHMGSQIPYINIGKQYINIFPVKEDNSKSMFLPCLTRDISIPLVVEYVKMINEIKN